MPRKRNLSASQQKRPLEKDEEDSRISPKKIKEDNDVAVEEDVPTESSSQSDISIKVDVPEQHDQIVVIESADEELEKKGNNSGSDEETETRERSLSTSSTSEQRHRSLEALFQVTDTELQAISKQGPEGHRIVHIEHVNELETVYVIDPGIQDREELVGEPEVVQEEIHIPVADSPEPDEEHELSIHRKRVGPAHSRATLSTPQPSTSAEEDEAIDTPKWRQFKNIERILQNAGIDTSSKTWHTLTRPGRHICPYCQRACTKPSVLEKHIRAHTGERPYPCMVCGFSFKTKSNLYKHCKSRAHTLKTNVEAKKMRAQGLAEASGNEAEVQTIDGSEYSPGQLLELDKKKMEPAQRHVIQEVVKYLEKGKGQRPNEVQTERQRAKLERLKSVQEKSSSDLKKKDDIRSFQRQLSLPVLPTNYSSKGPQFQKIAPKMFESTEGSSIGEVKNLAKILVPGSFLVNEKGEVVQTLSSVENAEDRNVKQEVSKSQADDDPLFYNQIEIVNLPDPDTDPETSTKALHDLEELSEKFSKAAKDGLRLSTAVQSLPDKRVQVVLQLQHPGKEPVQKSLSGDEDMPLTPVVSRSISSSALKERIQKLISANAAIVDTPKVEPPRAKCIKRNMSRQDSETPQQAQSETEAAVSGLLMPNISSVPLQPMALEGEIVYQSGRDSVWNKKQGKKIVVEKMEYEGEDVLIINNETSDDEQFDSPVKFSKDGIKGGKDDYNSAISTETTVVQTDKSGIEPSSRRVRSQFSGKGLRAGLELPLTTTFLPVVSSSGITSHLKQSLPTVSSSVPGQPGSLVRGHKPTSSVIMSPMTISSSPHTPGHIGKMALKNLQMKSRSLSLSSAASQTPVLSQTVFQMAGQGLAKSAGQTVNQAPVQYSVGTPSQAPVHYVIQTESQTPTQYRVQTQGQTPVQYTVQTPGQVPAQYTVQTPGQGPVQYTVQTPGQGPTHYTVQTPGQAPAQYTIQTPGQAPAQLMVQTPGQTPTQYVLQTPTTPVAQVLLPGSSVPVLLLGSSGGAQVHPISQPNEQPTVILQQTQQQIPQGRTPIVIQTPAKTPSQPTATSVQGRTYFVQQEVQGLPGSQSVLTGHQISSTVSTPKSSVVVAQAPLSLPSSQTDPMKILSSIVSNTVNQQRVTTQSKTQSQQPKEIKIEIKLPPPLQTYGPASQATTSVASSLQKSKPPLKRQNPVSMVHSPPILNASPVLSSPKPVFRFKNIANSLASASKISTPTNPSTAFRPQIASVRSLGQTSTTPSTSKLPQTSVIKEFLLRGKTPDEITHDAVDRNVTSELEKKQVLFFCPFCHISFKKRETLDLHVLCYCKNKNQAGGPAVKTGSLTSSKIQTEIVSKLFNQFREGKVNVDHKLDEHFISKEDTSKRRSIFKSRTENLDDSPTNKKRKFELPLNRSRSVIMSPRGKTVQTLENLSSNETTKRDSDSPLASTTKQGKLVRTKMSEDKTQNHELAKKDLWQSKLKGQILKRKLAKKLLLNRSMSVDNSLNKKPKPDQFLNKLGLKTRFSDNLYKDQIREKRPRLVRSYDDTSNDGILIKRPVFRRSKSVPEIPKDEEDCFEEADSVEIEDKDEEEEKPDKTKEDEGKNWLGAVSVPFVTADVVINCFSAIKPIYQQNFRMKSFEGMGTPVQLVPSATLTPRPELMEIEKVRKMFTFESGSLKLVQPTDSENESPTKSPSKLTSLKLPVLPSSGGSDSSLKTTQTSSQSQSKSPKLLAVQSPSTPKKSPNVHQFSLVGHTYPSMRSMTHLTFCCVDRLQPSYVRSGKKVSMYSNWKIAQQNTNPLGLATRTLLSLYNSRYSTNPVWVINCGADPRSGAITHSSYWKIKQGETNVDAIFSLIDLTEFPIEKEKKFEVGYKTTEESVYVRGRGRGKYVCETCGIRCKKPSMLKKHIRTHTDLRPYKCKHCRFSFKTKGNLQKHMKSKSHYKRCLDYGISPVPTAIDESQIDEEALQAQCYLSKRAKIVDKVNKSVDSIEKDTNTTDDNDDEDVEDEEDNKVDDDGEDDDDENAEDSGNISLDMSVDESKPGEDQEKVDLKRSEISPKKQEPSISQTQHNLFLQSLGIIAKQQLTGNQAGSQLPLTVTKSLQLPTVTSLGINLDSLNHLGAQKSVSSAASLSQDASTSSLSTVYGNFSHENEEEAIVNKDSDVIWGLLNLSDQSHSSSDSQKKLDTPTKQDKSEDQAHQSNAGSKSVQSIDLSLSGTRTKVKVTKALSFLPSYLSTASGNTDTTKLGSSKSGPIIGQILRNVMATSKGSTSEKSKSSTVFRPFQFQHPFPGTPPVVMSSSVVPAQNVAAAEVTTFSASSSATASAESVSESSKNSPESEVMYVQIGNTKGEVDTIQAQIVNIDPEVFKSRGSQDGFPSNVTEIPLENVLQLRKVSEGLYVITSEPEAAKIDSGSQMKSPQSLVKTPASLLPGNRVTGSTNHVTGSASHVTGSASHVTYSEGLSGRFVCSICKASFEEHHQLILHGNVHFLENSRLKCEKSNCSQKFRSHSALEKHLKSEHSVDTSDRLTVQDSDNPRPYKCDPCATAFRLKGHLTKHFRSRAHFKNLEALGKLSIGTWEKLENSVSDIDANTVEEFLAKVDILVHIGQSGSSGQTSWSQKDVSMDDDEVFIENDGSERVRVEMNEPPFEIRTVGETEKFRAYPVQEVYVDDAEGSSVSQEEVTVEDLYKVKPHKCGLCGRGFETVSELKSHLITHAELRPYVCEYCDAGFTNAQSLKIHLYTHAQGTPYVCGMCGMKFPNVSELTDHCKASHPPPGLGKPTTKPSTITTATTDISSNQNKPFVTMATDSLEADGQSSVVTNVAVQQHGESHDISTETTPVSSQASGVLDVSMTTLSQGQLDVAMTTASLDQSDVAMTTSVDQSSYHYIVKNTENNEQDPKVPVVAMETSSEVTGDGSDTVGTQHIVIPASSTEHNNLDVTSTAVGVENSVLNDAAIYLTEPLPAIDTNSIVYVESSELGILPVSIVSTNSSNIVLSESYSHPSSSENVYLNSSEGEQSEVSVIAVEYTDMRNETSPSVVMATDLHAENREHSTVFVRVAQEDFVAVETNTSADVFETGTDKDVLGLLKTEKQTHIEENVDIEEAHEQDTENTTNEVQLDPTSEVFLEKPDNEMELEATEDVENSEVKDEMLDIKKENHGESDR